ncbi:MAG: chorismate lyase [Gammaproteobacteria bacterium]
MNVKWHSISNRKLHSATKPLRACLQQTGSLTQHLEKFCKDDLQLYLKNQSWQRPLNDEARVLKLRMGEHAMVREIYFKCNNAPWVYARSIIPAKTLRGAQRRLAHWGNRSLGSYLFSGRSIYRGKMEVSTISRQNRLFTLAMNNTSDENETLWGRRSIFYIKDKPLLVVEIFLPEVIKCINTRNR